MSEQLQDPVQALFDQAVELPLGERAGFLDAACRDNPALRAEVESLLAHDDNDMATDAGDGLLKSPLVRKPAATHVDGARQQRKAAGIPQRLGRYRILACLAEGGMGIVYQAEQDNPRRPVALKVIRPGLLSPALLKRFTQEAQFLGRLHHPGIAQIYEAGMADDGQPFFAMEFIRGLPLDEYVRHHQLDPAARLALMARVCDAVQHAHDQAVIHRDLKPANILVVPSPHTPLREAEGYGVRDGQPKVLDFGVARATDADVQTAGSRTQTGQLIGTLRYMSPEQVAGAPGELDQRCDVYALGVILFELLTDRLPYFLDDLPLPEVARVIREKEPSRLGAINSAFRGDVETIVGKALEKDKARRYASAGELAADIRRHLSHEPIRARPPSAMYLMKKFVRRHKALVSGVLAVMAALVVGLIGTLIFALAEWDQRGRAEHHADEAVAAGKLAEARLEAAVKATREAEQARKDALEEADAARQVAELLGGLFEEADPYVLTGRILGGEPISNPSAMDLVNRGAARLANPETFKTKPLVRASLLDKVGHVFMSRGDGAKAGPFVIEALELRKKHLPAVHPDLASSLHNVGFLHLIKGNHKNSKELFSAAFEMRAQLFGVNSAQAMTSRLHFAVALARLGAESAQKHLLEVLEFQRAALQAAKKQHPETVGPRALECGLTLITLCHSYSANGEYLKAAPYVQEAHEVMKQIPNPDLAALGAHVIAMVSWQTLGNTDRAVKELRQGLAVVEKLGGKHHFLYVMLQREMATQYFFAGRFVEAEKTFLEIEDNYRQTIGGDGTGLAGFYYDTARSIQRGALVKATDLEQRRVQAARAEKYARAAYQLAKQSGVDAADRGTYAVLLAHILLYDRSEPDDAGAEAIAREALRIRSDLFGAGHELTSHPHAYLFMALARQNKVDDIERTILDLLARNPQPKWQVYATDALPEAARTLARAGKSKTALLLLEQAARAGFYNLDDVRSDPAFAVLREAEEYGQLLKKLTKPLK